MVRPDQPAPEPSEPPAPFVFATETRERNRHAIRLFDRGFYVGECYFSRMFPNRSGRPSAAETGYIDGLSVAESYRGRGLGRLLMVAALNRLQEMGCRAVRLTTGGSNVRAQNLYYSLGFTLSAGYTWSRTIDNRAPTGIDPYNTALDKALSPFHLEHRFFSAGVWELPYGRGRAFGSNLGRVPDAIPGGWQTSAFAVLETGNPLTITTSGDNLNTGGGYLQVPNVTAQPNLPAGDRTRSRFFRTDVFQKPALYTIGTVPISVVLALLVGMTAGYLGGWADDVLTFITNLFLIVSGVSLLV